MRRWADTLARRFAQLPTEGLKGVAFETGLSGVEAFLSRADEEIARKLDAVTDPDSDWVRPEPEETRS